MTKLTVTVRTHEYTTREPEDDGWDCGDTDATYEGCEVYLGEASGRGWHDVYTQTVRVPFKVEPGQTVYPVVVRYGTGSTFGHRGGCVTVTGVWETYEDAHQAEELVRQYGGYEEITVQGQTFYTGTWIGYFESLEGVVVESQVVQA
jgi:hypothetical protein